MPEKKDEAKVKVREFSVHFGSEKAVVKLDDATGSAVFAAFQDLAALSAAQAVVPGQAKAMLVNALNAIPNFRIAGHGPSAEERAAWDKAHPKATAEERLEWIKSFDEPKK